MKHAFTYLLSAFGLLATLTATAQNVGIGTTSPTQTLDVNGNLRVRGLTGTGLRLTQVAADGTVGISQSVSPVTVLTTPTVQSSTATQVSPTGIHVNNGYAYVTSWVSNELRVFSLANPVQPVQVGTPVTGGGTSLDLLTSYGNYLYVCDNIPSGGTIRIYTTTGAGTVTTPSFVGTVAAGRGPDGIAVSGNFLYVACVNDNTIQRFSLSNPAVPALLGSTPCTLAAGLAVSGNYLYAANYISPNGTLQTFAVDPTTGALTSQGTVAAGNYANGVAVSGNNVYVSNDGGSTLNVFSLTNPALPALIGTANVGTNPYGIAVVSPYAYVTSRGSNALLVAQVVTDNIIGFNSSGQLASVPLNNVADNLGDHLARRNINLADKVLVGGSAATPGTSGISISTAGNVGINSAAPVAKLTIEGSGTAYPATTGTAQSAGHYARFSDNSSLVLDMGGFSVNGNWLQSTDAGNLATTYPLVLNPNGGRVGIGTGAAAPTATLHVGGATSTVKIDGFTGTGTRLLTSDASGNVTATQDANAFILNQFAAVQSGTFSISGASFIGGAAQFGSTATFTGNVAVGPSALTTRLNVEGAGNALPAATGTTQSAGHYARFSDNTSAVLDMGGNGVNGNWLQSTDASGLNTVYPLMLNPNGGKVGVGTAAPMGFLDVQGGANATGGSDGGGIALSFRNGANSGFRHFIRSRHNSSLAADGNDIDFFLNNSTANNGSTGANAGNIQVMTLENNAGTPRVGIGTTAPAAGLDVNGTVQLGVNGSTFNAVVRAASASPTAAIGSIAINGAALVTFTVPNTATTGTVSISPNGDLNTGLVISYVRVSAAGTVTVKISNFSAAAITPTALTYNITVVQ